MQHLFGGCFEERKPVPESWRNVRLSSDSSLRTLTTVISVLLATILLFGATAFLTLVTDLSRTERMAMIGCFTATFAILVGIFTNCKRSELFVAVATYSAVLVVFAEVTKDG